MVLFRRPSASRAGEPEGSRDPQGHAPASSVLTGLCDGVLDRQGVHRGPVALSLAGWLDLRSGFSIDGDGRTRRAWAAPPLSLTLTGESTGLSQLYEEDRLRAQHCVEVAEAHRNGALPSSRRGRRHLHTCVVQPGSVGTWTRQSRQNTRPTVDGAGTDTAEKKENNPLSGAVCLLTRGGLIRVRPASLDRHENRWSSSARERSPTREDRQPLHWAVRCD
jgi:hypothetical protein